MGRGMGCWGSRVLGCWWDDFGSGGPCVLAKNVGGGCGGGGGGVVFLE